MRKTLFLCALLIWGASTIIADDTPIMLEVNRICEQNGTYIDFRGMSDGEENGYYYIDLGLSSGTKWATRNIGAATEDDEGDLFAWGETTPSSSYEWQYYKWCNGDDHSLTKYCVDPDYGHEGFTDGKTILDPEDDVVVQTWGGAWRMPTADEVSELVYWCVWEPWGNGYMVTGPNGHRIYMPIHVRTGAIIWSSTLDTSASSSAFGAAWQILLVNANQQRAEGFHVRGVCH